MNPLQESAQIDLDVLTKEQIRYYLAELLLWIHNLQQLRGIIHCDINLDNLLLVLSCTGLQLADFGPISRSKIRKRALIGRGGEEGDHFPFLRTRCSAECMSLSPCLFADPPGPLHPHLGPRLCFCRTPPVYSSIAGLQLFLSLRLMWYGFIFRSRRHMYYLIFYSARWAVFS
ncbi:hypothetical protein K438DRAFT_472408 [Mycena galopus ATCC 62051]|nr:hypothetical protein K438DRAFT_472408 [Mycena galopus ATCC 62051]